jgi:opacity protein-like surface antigen
MLPRSATVGLLAVLGFGFISPCQAQANRVPEAQVEAPRWRITFTPDLWASGLTGNVGVGGLVTEVSLSFSDIIDQFDIGVMGLLEARRTPWVLRADLFFVNLGDETGAITVNQEQLMLQPEVGRTIVTEPWGTVDLLVGARYWNLSVDLTAPPEELSSSQGWVDATFGAAWRFQPGQHWRLFAKGDLGGGGSQFTWQGLGGAGYNLGSCCTLVAAYRYLDVDYQKDRGLVYDVHLNGPALGLTLHF